MGKFISAFFLSPPEREEMFPQCIWPPVLSSVGAIGTSAALDYVVLSKWMLIWWGYRLAQVSSRAEKADGSQRFCVRAYFVGFRHPDAWRALSVVLCIIVFAVPTTTGRNKKKRKKSHFQASKQTGRQMPACSITYLLCTIKS
jgi:hypothetical protein